MSGFCHFGLVYSWFCDRALTLPSCRCFHVSAWLRVCLSSALSSACPVSLFHVGAWCSDPGNHVLLSFGFVSGFGHSRSMFCLVVGACSLEFARAVCSSVHVDCVVLCFCMQLMLSATCFHVVLCLVLCTACAFHWLRAFHVVMSCVNTRLMSILISCVFVSWFFMSCFVQAHGL